MALGSPDSTGRGRLPAANPDRWVSLPGGGAITKHLHLLTDARLVRGSRQGRERVWELEPEPLEKARRCLDLISEQWDQALARLKVIVER